MSRHQADAFIIPSTDPHLSEYVAPHWMSREWLSGFTGSAGTLVVTHREAGLWTDSRYYLQAGQQLAGSCIHLYKEGLAETPTITQFLQHTLSAGGQVGINGQAFSAEQVRHLQRDLEGKALTVCDLGDPMDNIWQDRPTLPASPAFVHDARYAGRLCSEKLTDIRHILQENRADALLLCSLDEIAWALNLRGSDVHCNPVVVSYLLITQGEAHYFIQPGKVTPSVRTHLAENNVTLHPYEDIFTFLPRLPQCNIWIDPAHTNQAVYRTLPEAGVRIERPSPVALLKAIRNQTEIEGLHSAMKRDGVAMVKFLIWLEQAVPQGGVTEVSAARKLQELRSRQPLYMGESFDTIAGYREHGAIVHYEATAETDIPLRPEGFLLLDSGAQYLDGTTDITRTISLGRLTEEEQTDYTLILQGHIALAQAVFPAGTRGAQLDVLARLPLWKSRMNYLHGTGHGVGHFLNVHEGPQSIRMNENPIPLQCGMVTSNEPGVYKAGSHGVRIENLLLTVPAGEGMFGNYLRFETLTLCPIDTRPIRKELLTPTEIDWLNRYHQHVYDSLESELNEEEKAWLKQATREI